MTDSRGNTLAWDGGADQHEPDVRSLADQVISTGRQQMLSHSAIVCERGDCPVRGIVVVPLESDGSIIGTLGAVTTSTAGPVILRATAEVARYVSSQLELAELEDARARLDRAEVRALRAQISPHFIYNALSAIASFVRTDPEHARALILDFAEFTRYSFRAHGEFTTLAEELHSIDRYLTIERARFGERLDVRLQIAPEVLPVTIPYLCLQPLVENAVRHGLSGKTGVGTVTIVARDAGAHCQITVEDDGVGMDPDALGQTGAGDEDAAHVGLTNVDERLRSVFGDEFGLVVETAPGAGTKVSVRVPKFHPGVRPSQPAAPPAAPPPGLRVPT
ncbi:MAG TPA: histidine kinase, partial [Nakamurella sp.]